MTRNITYKVAMHWLRQHGLTIDMPTAVDSEGHMIENSTFEAEFGVREVYNRDEVLGWLGY